MRIPSLGTTKFLPKTLARRKLIRGEWLERCGLSRYSEENKRKDLRICISHKLEVVRKTTHYDSPDGRKSFSFKFEAPVQTAPKSFTNITSPTLNKGTAIDRGIANTAKYWVEYWGDPRAMGKDVAAEKEFGDINAVNDAVAKIVDIEKTPVDTSPVKKRKFFQYQKKKHDAKPSIFSLEGEQKN